MLTSFLTMCSKVGNFSFRKPLKRLVKTSNQVKKSVSKCLPSEKELPMALDDSLHSKNNDNLPDDSEHVGSPQPICQSRLLPYDEADSSDMLVSVIILHLNGISYFNYFI